MIPKRTHRGQRTEVMVQRGHAHARKRAPSAAIEPKHIAEAIQYRTLDRSFWRDWS